VFVFVFFSVLRVFTQKVKNASFFFEIDDFEGASVPRGLETFLAFF